MELNKTTSTASVEAYNIIDIGGSRVGQSCRKALNAQFFQHRTGRCPFVDDMLMSSDAGLAQWSDLNRLPNYYQTNEEITLLEKHGAAIAAHILPGCSIIDLGSADTRKIKPLLDRIESRGCTVTYYSVDLSRPSLATGLAKLATQYRHIKLVGLWGTFDDALQYCKSIASPRFLMSLGSMIGNDRWDDSVRNLTVWASLMGPEDTFLMGIDSHSDRDKIWASYHDEGGVFERFLRTGMAHTNDILGVEWWQDNDWTLGGEFREDPLVHAFVFTAVRDVVCPPAGISFKAGDRIECYEGHKYTLDEMDKQFAVCGLRRIGRWKSPDGEIYEHLLSKADSV